MSSSITARRRGTHDRALLFLALLIVSPFVSLHAQSIGQGGAGGAAGPFTTSGAGGNGGAAGGANGSAGSPSSHGGTGGAGGTGGTAASPNGQAGGTGGEDFSTLGTGGGGGGGGGYNGNGSGIATISNTGSLIGGNGGAGAEGEDGFGSGGGGGAGGYGVVVIGAGANTNSGTITGGNGGLGASVSRESNSGNGGDGGVGVRFTTTGATLTNSSAITGGNGGSGSSNGAGGPGIYGASLNIINSGSIAGGLAGDGTTRADAIDFTGGTNSLTIQAGSSITGNVVAASTADTLALGGDTNASFDLSQIGSAVQYQGFGILEKSGASTWTLSGTTTTALQSMTFELAHGAIVIGDPATNSGIATLATGPFIWTGGSAIDFQLGATPAASDAITVAGALTKASHGIFVFHFSDGAAPASSACGTVYTLISASSISGFAASDFSFDYSGSNASFAGSISIVGNNVVFATTPCAQTITNFAATPSSPTYAPGGTFTVSATGGASDNPVAFSIASTSASVCSAGGTNGATITILAAGACTVLADQAGNISYTAAPEVSLPVTIAKASQTITFGTQAAQTYSSGGTFAISPMATGGASGNPVTYSSLTSSVCTVSGSTVTIVSAGTCTLAADQAGNGNYLAANEATQSVTIGAATSGTTLTSSAPTAVFGQSVTLTATVTGQTPTGSVTFNDGATVLCSAVSVSGGGNSPTATCSTSALAVGAHAISASYTSANTNNGNSSANLSQTVNAAATTTTITPPASISLGQSVTVSASVAVTSPGAGTPTGTIAIGDGGTGSGDTCTITLPATSCSLTPSSAGTATLTATYSGDSDFVMSAGTVTLSISTMTSSITLTSSPNPSTAGQAVTLTATVSAVTPASVRAQFTASGLGAPSKPHATFPEAGMINRAPVSGIATVTTGSVTFSDGGAVLATVALNAYGVATYSTTALTAGSHTISASYSGDANDSVATITDVQQVNPAVAPTPAQPAPTLSIWMLALLGLTLACAGLRYARRQTMH